MNDVYEINVAKAEFREAYNTGNVDRLLAVFADEFTDMSAGVPSFFGTDAKSVFRSRMTKLLQQYEATLTVTIIAIRVLDNSAFDYGWRLGSAGWPCGRHDLQSGDACHRNTAENRRIGQRLFQFRWSADPFVHQRLDWHELRAAF